MWPMQYGHSGEYTPCAINKWIRPQKTNKNTDTRFLWAKKKTGEQKKDNSSRQPTAASAPLLSKSPGDRLVRGHEGRERPADAFMISQSFPIIRFAPTDVRGWVDKHAVAARGLRAALWLVRCWNALDVSQVIFCSINWCATMEYKTPGKTLFLIMVDTLTHIFRANGPASPPYKPPSCFLFSFCL